MKFSTTGSAATGTTTIAVDGVEPTNLIGVTGGNPKWLDSDTLIFQYEVSPSVFGLGTLDPPSGALVNLDSIGQNNLAAGNNVYAAYLASGANVGVRTNVSGFGPFPLAGLGDMDESGRGVFISAASTAMGLQGYSAAGVQTFGSATTLTNANVRARSNMVAYEDASGWHLLTISTGAILPLATRADTVTLMIPVLVGTSVYVVEFSSTYGMTVRGATSSRGYVLPSTTANFFNGDAVCVTSPIVRVGGCVNAGEAPTELRVYDLNVATGALSYGVTSAGALTFSPLAPLTPVTFQTSGGSATLSALVNGIYPEPLIGPGTNGRISVPWYRLITELANAINRPIDLNSAQVTGVLQPQNGGTGTTSSTTVLPGWISFSAASRLLGRGSSAGAGAGQEISLGDGLSMSGTTLSVNGGLMLTADPASPADDTWWVVREGTSPTMTIALRTRVGGVTYQVAAITV